MLFALNAHPKEELDIAAGLLELVEYEFHRLDGRHASEGTAENNDFVVFVGMVEQFLFACAGTFDVNRRENAAVDKGAIEVHFHVAGAFEFFEDNFVHAGACIDEGGRDDCERTAFFDVTGGTEKAFGFMQRVGIDTAGQNLAGVRLNGVVSAGEAGDRVEENNDVALVLDHAAGFFDDHLSDLNVALGWFVEGGTDDFSATAGAFHVGHFLRTLVNQKDKQGRLWIFLEDCICGLLHQNGLGGARRSHDEAAGPFADWTDEVEDASGKFVGGSFENETLVREQWREIVEMGFVFGLVWIFLIDGFDFEQREEALFFFGRPDLAGNEIAGLKIETANLRG